MRRQNRETLRLGILFVAFLAVLPALAQVPGGPISPPTTAVITPRQHAPMRLHGLVPGAVQSENWSGFAVTGKAFTQAMGSWHVPGVNCTKTPNTYSAFWVGIDGYNSSTVEQTGTSSDCSGTTPQYYAWYEFYPAGSVVISSVPVTSGNVMSAEVSYNGSQFTVTITNETTGKSFSKTSTVSGAKRSSAEWIAEAPCCTTGGGILPLADFVKANFGYDKTGVSGTNYATDTSTSGPISVFGSRERITMVSSKSVVEAVPTVLTTDGTSFSVTWKSE